MMQKDKYARGLLEARNVTFQPLKLFPDDLRSATGAGIKHNAVQGAVIKGIPCFAPGVFTVKFIGAVKKVHLALDGEKERTETCDVLVKVLVLAGDVDFLYTHPVVAPENHVSYMDHEYGIVSVD